MMLRSLKIITDPMTLDRHDEPEEDMMQSTVPAKPAHQQKDQKGFQGWGACPHTTTHTAHQGRTTRAC